MNFAMEGITGIHVWEANDHWSLASHSLQSNRLQIAPPIAHLYSNLFIYYFYSGSIKEFGDRPGILGGWVYNPPVFEPTIGRMKSFIPRGA